MEVKKNFFLFDIFKRGASIALFLALSTGNFATEEQAAEKVLDFYFSGNHSKFEIRDLRKLSEEERGIIKYKDEKEYTYYRGKIKEEEEKNINTVLYKGYEYIIKCSADDTITDIDVFVYDSDGNIAAIDRNPEKNSFPKFIDMINVSENINNDKSIIGKEISVKPIVKGEFIIKIKSRGSKNKEEGNWVMVIAGKKSEK